LKEQNLLLALHFAVQQESWAEQGQMELKLRRKKKEQEAEP